MANSNPSVAGKKHRQLMSAHYDRLLRLDGDMRAWLAQIETAHQDYYNAVLTPLLESGTPEDQELWEELDIEYSQQMSSLQAARERITEALAHVRKAIVPGAQTAPFKNVTPETFQ